MTTNPNNPFSSASLYVGDLDNEVTETMLFEIFNAVGPVASIRVCRDATTRRSLGYAYVNFHNVLDAERALDTMNYTVIRGRQCRIMWSQRDPSLRKSGVGNIFVKNLDRSIDSKTLFDTFSMFGNIVSCKVAMNRDRSESLGYGFVHYETEEAAVKAIESVDGMIIGGQKVNVAPFKPRNERPSTTTHFTNIYVKNLPDSIDTEEKLNDLFAKYGTITKSALSLDEDKKPKGFGFVNYDSHEGASAAIEAMHDTELDGKKLYVGQAQTRTERDKELKERFEKMKLEQQKKYAGVNLYIKNIIDEMTDEQLREEFGQFGTITSARIMRDSAGRSKGFGFVCFSSPEEATKAVTQMNNKMLNNKPLYVALAQPKELRRMTRDISTRKQLPGIAGPIPGQPMYPPVVGGAPMFYRPVQANMPNMVYPQMVGAPRGGTGARWAPGAMPGQQVQMLPQNVRPQGIPPQPYINAMNANAPRGGRAPAGLGSTSPTSSRNFKYVSNVRNQDAMNRTEMPHQPAAIPQAAIAPGHLTAEVLANAQPPQQKQMIGERLFPLIQQIQPDRAGKITGMLLEMDNGELLNLLESKDALSEKISEAVVVLEDHDKRALVASTEK